MPAPVAPLTAAGAPQPAGAFGPEGTLEFLKECGREQSMVTIVLKEQGAHHAAVFEGRVEGSDKRHVRVMSRANMDEVREFPQRGWVLIAAADSSATNSARSSRSNAAATTFVILSRSDGLQLLRGAPMCPAAQGYQRPHARTAYSRHCYCTIVRTVSFAAPVLDWLLLA
jgi:hypothetical protein